MVYGLLKMHKQDLEKQHIFFYKTILSEQNIVSQCFAVNINTASRHGGATDCVLNAFFRVLTNCRFVFSSVKSSTCGKLAELQLFMSSSVASSGKSCKPMQESSATWEKCLIALTSEWLGKLGSPSKMTRHLPGLALRPGKERAHSHTHSES